MTPSLTESTSMLLVFAFSEEEVAELSHAADKFISDGTPLTGISQTNLSLLKLSKPLASIRSGILNGNGFILFKGFPTEKWGNQNQNGHNHALGHVKDVGDDAAQIDKVRIYRTSASLDFPFSYSRFIRTNKTRQFFHADDSDIVLQGEVSESEEPYIKTSDFYLKTCPDPRVYSKWDPYYIKSLDRFMSTGIIPPLSLEKFEAAKVLECTYHPLSLRVVLEIGDIQFLSNEHVLHTLTAYRDHAPPESRRYLVRLWLVTPKSEGGWKLPFHDLGEERRGKIRVNTSPPVTPLDAG
ncbi:hypothetical protein BJ878DRAFT_531590 [Calycina marina]|uniref:TauD/TfdA-like domain-containing protein n=1 Tax=Calycina marina TaxID=1763456 RepID=A0A9P7ZC63_9HELO|nr:hypothetical protein BJ878DRAFT_531590 [Calycina marina]